MALFMITIHCELHQEPHPGAVAPHPTEAGKVAKGPGRELAWVGRCGIWSVLRSKMLIELFIDLSTTTTTTVTGATKNSNNGHINIVALNNNNAIVVAGTFDGAPVHEALPSNFY